MNRKRAVPLSIIKVIAAAGLAVSIFIIGTFAATSAPTAQTGNGVPNLISYQGYLTDDSGNPIDGTATLTFGIYTDVIGGSLLWSETQPSVPISDGYFSVMLGSVTPLSSETFSEPNRYLQVGVDSGSGTVELPRQQFTAVPYALNAANAWSLHGNSGTDPQTHKLGTTDAVSLTLVVSDTAVFSFDPAVNFLGEFAPIIIANPLSNTAKANFDGNRYGNVIAGGTGNESSGIYTTISGGLRNAATESYATVAGGYLNKADGPTSFAGGGYLNKADGDRSVVTGGYLNEANGGYSAVVGGEKNVASGEHSTVSGGYSNQALGVYASIGGGDRNMITDTANYATISGGFRNDTTGRYATVGGGSFNKATRSYATIGGGTSNIATGGSATVGGGASNQATQAYSTVSGGQENEAKGWYATVDGGQGNEATGDYSHASGRRAHALHHGTFVWSDSTNADFSSTGRDQFLIDAGGGMGVGTNDPTTQLHVVAARNGSANMADHVMGVENNSGTTTNGPDVLALKVTNLSDPGASTNYITFADKDGGVGRIEGNGSGGVNYETTGADFAEYLPLTDPFDTIGDGMIVGLAQGGISQQTARAERLFVISSAPGFVGNASGDGEPFGMALVALIGQVEVQVNGPVQAGDYVVASGLNDGRGIGVSLADLQAEQVGQVVGLALESAGDDGQVLVLVGLPPNAIWQALLASRDQQLADLEARLARLEQLMLTEPVCDPAQSDCQ